MERVLLVDGHSAIFAWPGLREMHRTASGAARERLVRILTEYQDATGCRVAVVFDGKGPRASDESEPGGIQIFYSRAGQTADAIIERFAAKYGNTLRLTVATDDSLERRTVETLGATSIPIAGLRAEIDRARQAVSEAVRARRRPPRP